MAEIGDPLGISNGCGQHVPESHHCLDDESELVLADHQRAADYQRSVEAAQRRWDAFYRNPSNGYC